MSGHTPRVSDETWVSHQLNSCRRGSGPPRVPTAGSRTLSLLPVTEEGQSPTQPTKRTGPHTPTSNPRTFDWKRETNTSDALASGRRDPGVAGGTLPPPPQGHVPPLRRNRALPARSRGSPSSALSVTRPPPTVRPLSPRLPTAPHPVSSVGSRRSPVPPVSPPVPSPHTPGPVTLSMSPVFPPVNFGA